MNFLYYFNSTKFYKMIEGIPGFGQYPQQFRLLPQLIIQVLQTGLQSIQNCTI